MELAPTQRAEGLPKLARAASDDDANAPTVTVGSPRKLEIAATAPMLTPPAPSPASPHSLASASAPPPPLFGGEPLAGPLSAPANPLSVPPPAPGPPPVVSGPSEPREGGSGRVIVFVSLVLIAFSAAMAAYVLWRGNLPLSQ